MRHLITILCLLLGSVVSAMAYEPSPAPTPHQNLMPYIALPLKNEMQVPWIKHKYVRKAGATWSKGTIDLALKGIECNFTIAVEGPRGECGVDGNGKLRNGAIIYTNKNMNGPNDGSTVVLQKINSNTIIVTGGGAYCPEGVSLEGVYRLVK